MQLPIKAHYATVAMLALAQHHQSGQLATARMIADEHGIPPQFLNQILQQLRTAGMISSTRGSSGGFRLERAPSSITLAEIIDAVCPFTAPIAPQSNSPLVACAVEVWQMLSEQSIEHLRQIKLSHLLERAESNASVMFYI